MGIRLSGPVAPEETTPKKVEAEAHDAIPVPKDQNYVDHASAPAVTGGQPDRSPASTLRDVPDDVFSVDHTADVAAHGPSQLPQKAFDDVFGGPAPKPDTLAAPRILSRDIDKQQTKNVFDVAEKLNIKPDEAMSLLSTAPLDELKTRPDLANIDTEYPGVTTWARNPEHFAILKQDPRWAKLTEDRTTILGFVKDAKNIAVHNYYTMKQMAYHDAVANGLMTPDKAAIEMGKVQDEIDQNPMVNYERESRNFDKDVNNLGTKVSEASQLISTARRMSKEDKDNIFQTGMKIASALKLPAQASLDFAMDMVKHPGAALLYAGKGAAAMVPGIVAGYGGAIGGGALAVSAAATAGASIPVAAGLGFLGGTAGAFGGGYAGGFGSLYGMKMMELQEQYRDKKTGKVNFSQMYSDPAAVAKMKNIATKYAGAHAVFDGILSSVSGGLVSKAIEETGEKAAATGISKAAKVVQATGKEAARNAAIGGIGETTARLASGDTPEQAVVQGLNVALTTPVIEAARVTGMSAIERMSTGPSRANIEKLSDAKVASEESIKNRNVLQLMRTEKAESTVPSEFPRQAQELVKAIDQKARYSEDTPAFISEKLPAGEDAFTEDSLAQARPHDKAGRPTFIEFNTRQFEAVANELGKNPLEVAQELGPNAIEAYQSAKKNDSTQFRLDHADYYRYSDNLPELDDIAYVNGSTMNHVDAVETLKQIDEAQKSMFSNELPQAANPNNLPRSEMTGGGDEPPTEMPQTPPSIEDTLVHFPKSDPQMGDPVLRPIELMQTGRSEQERKVFRDLKNSITRTTKAAGIDPRMADVMAELQFRNTRFRAEQLGLPIEQVAEQIKVGYQKSLTGGSSDSLAYFKPGNDEGGQPRSRVIFGPSVKANTVIHEFAHSWLHNMANDWNYIDGIQDRNEAQQEYHNAMTSAAKLLGLKNVGDLLNLGETPVYKKVHETWAQTAEKYFLEGNFEKSKIRAVFESMRKWMSSVASVIGKAYPQFPALQISPEVSRVFQTILEGNTKVEDNMGRMFPDPLFKPEMLGAKAEAYQKAVREARDQAIGQMYSKFYTRSEKEREVLINKSLNDIYDEAHTQIEALPSIQLFRDIKAGGEEARISHQSVLEALAGGDEAKMKEIQDNTPKLVIAGKKKVGLDVREVMKYMNIHDPEEMIKTLREMNERDTMVDNLANQLVDERFPALKSDEEIHNEAVAAINNAGREKVLKLELEALAKEHLKTLQKMSADVAMPAQMVGKQAMDVIKKQGQDMVMQTKALGLRPNDFMNAAARHGKRAADYLAKGDYENAFWEKQQEAVNYHAYREAQQQYINVNKTTAAIKRMKAQLGFNMPKMFDADYFQYGQVLIRALESGKGLPDIDTQGFKNKAIVDQSRTEAINSKIAAINDSLIGKNPEQISVQAYNAFGELLSIVRNTAKVARTVELENFNMDIDIAGTLTGLEVGPRRAGDPTISMNKGFFSRWNADLINVRNLMTGLMGEEKYAKSNISKLLQNAFEAEAKFITEKNIDEQKLSESVQAITKDNPEMQSIFSAVTKRFVQFAKGEVGKPIAAKEIGFTFNNEGELHQFMLYLGSDSGREKLAMGGLRSKTGELTGKLGYFDPETGKMETPKIDEMVKRMMDEGILRKEHFDFYQTVWDAYERHYQPSKDAIRKVYGYEIGKIGSRKMETPWGDYKGGYVPSSKDRAYMDASTSVADFATDQPGTSVKDLFPVTNTSFGKERTAAYYPMSLELGNLRNKLNAVYRAAYLMPTMFEVGKVLDHSDFQSALEQRRPGAMEAVVKPWFKRVMAQQYSEPSSSPSGRTMDKLFRSLRNNTRTLAFLGNYATVGKQYLGTLPAMTVVEPQHLMRAAAEVGFAPGEAISKIAESSPRMKQRFDDNARRAVRSFEDFTLHMDKIDKIDSVMEKLTYAPIQWAQNHVDAIVFTAAVDQATSKFKMTDEKQIYNYAADVVERTQHTSNISSRQGIMQGSEAKRLFTDFATYPLTMYGLNQEAGNRVADQPFLDKRRVQMMTLLATAALPATLGLMLSHPGKIKKAFGTDQDKEDYMKDMAAGVGAEFMEVNFPLVGRNVINAFGRGDQVGVSPALRAGKTIFNTVKTGAKTTFGDKELTIRDVQNMLDSITVISGIPTSVLNRGFKTLLEVNPALDPNR